MSGALRWLSDRWGARELGLVALVVACAATVGFWDPMFLSQVVWADLALRCAPTAIVACGVMLVVVTGEIDISVGSLMALLAAALGKLVSLHELQLAPWLGVPLVLAFGLGLGTITGLLVTWGRVPSIVATLGLLTAYRGLTVWMMGGRNIDSLPAGLTLLCKQGWWGIPLGIWAAVAVVGLTGMLLCHTPLGRRLYALGSSPESARFAGLSATRLKLFAFAYCGLLTAVATVVEVPRLPKIEAGIGVEFELLVVTCVVVGGVSVAGGRGRLTGVLLAVVLMTMLRPMFTFLDIGETAEKWTKALQGLLIAVAVVSDRLFAPRDESAMATLRLEPASARRGPWHELALLLLLAALVGIAGWLMPTFLRWDSQLLLSRQLWELAILACGMTLIIIAGGIDLSVGATMGLCAVVFGATHAATGSVGWASLACVGAGAACGGVNATLIAGARLHPLIVTLATLAAFRGIAEGFSQGAAYSRFGDSFSLVARSGWGIPWAGYATLALAVGCGVLLRRTPTGRQLFTIGLNEQAARFAGVPVERLKAGLYLASGLLASGATLIYVSRFDTAKADAGRGFELEAITAVVVGGTSIFGGRGGVWGTVLGLLLIHETRLFVSRYWRSDELRSVAIGFLLIAAVLVYQSLARRSSSTARTGVAS